MSRWDPDSDSKKETENNEPAESSVNPVIPDESPAQFSSSSPSNPGLQPKAPRKWVQFTPYVFSAILFLSAFFVIFAPIPIIVLYFQKNRRLALLAAATNSAIVYALAGPLSFAAYLVFIAVLALALSEVLDRTGNFNKAALIGFVAVFAVALVWATVQYKGHPLNAWKAMEQEVSLTVDTLIAGLPAEKLPEQFATPADVKESKEKLFLELPSALGIVVVLLVWSSLVTVLKLNPGSIRSRFKIKPDFFQTWKAPEFLVWPSIACGLFLLINVNYVTPIALNLFRVLMAVYALQGLSILSYFFTVWRLRGLFRTFGYVLVATLLTPVLISLGFFDLWFDFRAKIRQS